MSKKSPQNSNVQAVGSTSHAAAAMVAEDFDSYSVGAFGTRAFKTPAYNELLENPHIELDGLQRLEENLARLEDLHGRLHFLMRDISALLKK